MKITKVEAIELRLPESEMTDYPDQASPAGNTLVIKIYTDEGIIGVGEVESSARVAKAVVEAPPSMVMVQGLEQLMIGMNPLDIRVINDKLYQASFYYGRRGVVVHTIGGIDLALWDIAGKYYKQPIYQLLGGAYHKKIRAYASVLFGKDGNETCEIGEKWISKGFTAVKFGWAPLGQSEKLDLELVDGARRGVGDRCDVLIDAGCCWDTITAIQRVKQFEDYHVFWIEEPLAQDNIEGYGKLTNVSRVPIAAGEGHCGRFDFADLILHGGIHIAQIDLARNGFTEAMRIADLAEDHSLKVVNHFWTTGINLAASLHFLASRKSSFILEYGVENTPIRWDVTQQKMKIDTDGFVHVPEGPGLGVDLDDDTIERLRV
ncbi:MAG: mandelate racemase/muconate lactonizing enzyme family protein [Desulfobacteraceae bacterium]|nr:mandelate racemase/muconate lactonizing enzyme family protein [Desulfobacteraceae bacterium]